MLFVLHYQSETSLLFIYSQLKKEADYQAIAEAFSTDCKKIPRKEIHRVLGEMQEFELFNTGMENRFAETGESYKILSGSNVASSIDPLTGRMYSAGHVFCKARENGEYTTIGYSSGSKVWSSSYLIIPDYIKWCDALGKKIVNERINVKTNTNYDYMPIPERLDAYPQSIVFCFFSETTFVSPPTIIEDSKISNIILTDADLRINSINDESVSLSVDINGASEEVFCNSDGTVTSHHPSIILKDGRFTMRLHEYLQECPIIFRTSDDARIDGNEICYGDTSAIVYSSDNIVGIDWESMDVDIKLEFGISRNGLISIQTAIHDILATENSNYVIYDHGSGEIADFITINESDTTIEAHLYHVKSMGGKNFNSDITDIYEVTQQAIKSIIWLKSRSTLLIKIQARRKAGHCILEIGDYDSLERTLKSNKRFTAKIVVVQPAISCSSAMPEKYQEILAAATYYIKNTGRVTDLLIWGSP